MTTFPRLTLDVPGPSQESRERFAAFAARVAASAMYGEGSPVPPALLSHQNFVKLAGEALARDYGTGWPRVLAEIAAVAQQVSQADAHAREVGE